MTTQADRGVTTGPRDLDLVATLFVAQDERPTHLVDLELVEPSPLD